MQKKIESLFKLLDDENENIVKTAMSELLKHENDIAEWLAHHQESTNNRLRKRIHQLQAIITMRQRRRDFANLLDDENVSLIDGLIAVHQQWYDNDSERAIKAMWEKLIESSERFAPDSLEKLAYFMRKCGFNSVDPDELQADYFCLGPVLEEMTGADFILCSIGMAVAAHWKLELKVARFVGKFALIDGSGKALFPYNGWQLLPHVVPAKCEFWTNKQLLQLASTMLFLFSVSSDSFRYIHTIGHSLAGIIGEDELGFLPYPYKHSEDE
ncbi:hypothetical protein P0136_01750 [Lentisphaerota bacterium ZTH]|nr:hypothetical protein JYG24_07110 [Lentisphaerota bacterium]WET06736.1 hypothetical protein P0136_01750 [Lentisphaerota bacterium ZTH]